VTAKAAAEAEIFETDRHMRDMPDDARPRSWANPPYVIHLPYEPAEPAQPTQPAATPAEAAAPAPTDSAKRAAGKKPPGQRGKRKLVDPRDAWVHIRCTAGEHALITEKADKAGLSAGAYLRTLAIGTAGPRAVRRPPVEKEELARVLGELGRLGSNVNQIARVVNTTGNLAATSNLASIEAEVQTMRAALMKALGRGH
jgi:Bacterial mobilisation protein (MobC)